MAVAQAAQHTIRSRVEGRGLRTRGERRRCRERGARRRTRMTRRSRGESEGGCEREIEPGTIGPFRRVSGADWLAFPGIVLFQSISLRLAGDFSSRRVISAFPPFFFFLPPVRHTHNAGDQGIALSPPTIGLVRQRRHTLAHSAASALFYSRPRQLPPRIFAKTAEKNRPRSSE